MSPSVRHSRAAGPMASEGNAARNGRHHLLARSLGGCSHARDLPSSLRTERGTRRRRLLERTDDTIVHIFVSSDRF